MIAWAVGTSLCLLNGVLSSFGFILQRKAHLITMARSEMTPPELQKVEATQSVSPTCLLFVGVLIYASAALPDVIAYTLIPQIVCSTLACLRLVFVAFMAHFSLGERLGPWEVLGTAFCCIGTGLCLAFGPTGESVQNKPERGFYHPKVTTYLTVATVLLLALVVVEHAGDLLTRCDHVSRRSHSILPLTTALAFGIEKVFNTELGFTDPPHSLSEIPQKAVWTGMWLAVLILALLDFHLNLRGARTMPVQIFVPMVFAFNTSLQFFQSFAIFDEFQHVDSTHLAIALPGALLSLFGALMIQPNHVQPPATACSIVKEGHSAFQRQMYVEIVNSAGESEFCMAEAFVRHGAMSKGHDVSESEMTTDEILALETAQPADEAADAVVTFQSEKMFVEGGVGL